MSNQPFGLDHLKPGTRFQLVELANEEISLILLRFGLVLGDQLTLVSKIKKGPAVLEKGDLQVALGHDYCNALRVSIHEQ